MENFVMKTYFRVFTKMLADNRGSVLAEYALVTSVLTIACVGMIQVIGTIGFTQTNTATTNFSNTGVVPP
jgi:Flp pilus assembly pilin Flp